VIKVYSVTFSCFLEREKEQILCSSVSQGCQKDVAQNPINTDSSGPKGLVTSRKNIKNPKMTLS
jgi:hypothetical protein